VLHAHGLQVGYHRHALLPPVDFAIHREEMWALVGRNGSGKTTLLRTLLGLLPKVGGSFHWSPHVVIGYVPQRSDLDISVPSRVCDVVADGLDRGNSFLRPWLPAGGRERVQRVLEETGMAHVANTPFHALSDGQRQRVLVSRALVNDPSILVLDEPTTGMDVASESAAFDLFEKLQSDRKLAILIVTHQLAHLAVRASHALLVDKDENLFVQGTLDDVKQHPVFISRYGTIFGPSERKSEPTPGPARAALGVAS
jgi:ABC-type Mn2+/Zn2+ transport system ATPase subunit